MDKEMEIIETIIIKKIAVPQAHYTRRKVGHASADIQGKEQCSRRRMNTLHDT